MIMKYIKYLYCKKVLRLIIRIANLYILTDNCIPEGVHSRIVKLVEDIEYGCNNGRINFDIVEKNKYELSVLDAYSNVRYLNPGFDNKVYKIEYIVELEKENNM